MSKSPVDELLPRLLCIVRDLKAGQTFTRNQLAAMYRVDATTAGTYLSWIGRAEPLRTRPEGREKVWYWEEPETDPAGRTDTLRAMIAVNLARSFLGFLEGTPFQEAVTTLSMRLQQKLSKDEAAQAARVVDAVQLLRPRRPLSAGASGIVTEVLTAFHQQEGLRIEYRKGDGTRSRYEVEPRRLLFHNGRLVLLASKQEGAKRVDRTFVLDRVQSAERRPRSTCPIEPKGDPWRHAFGLFAAPESARPCKVRFTVLGAMAEVVRHVEVHPSEHREENADGSITLSIKVHICPELRTFLKSLIPDLVIHEPAGLRADVEEEVRRWLGQALAFTHGKDAGGAA